MKHVYVLLFSAGLVMPTVQAQQQFYADPFGDQHNTATGWVTNAGQLLGTDMLPASGVYAYTDGYGMSMWLMEKSSFRLSKIISDTIPGNNDTTLCVNLAAAGKAKSVAPVPYRELPGYSNYYYPHTDSSAEDVINYHREVYWEVWDGISMQFYTSRGGPKLAFVCEPGSDPAEILLACEGQDSLKVDPNGLLRMYIRGKWLVLNQALAYQIGVFGNPNAVVPLSWVPVYEEEEGTGKVHFDFGEYDTTKPLIFLIGGLPLAAAEVEEPRNLQWSTYAGSDHGDEFMATDVDTNGDVYVTGYTYQANFPVNTGFQSFPADNALFAGSEDVVTMKFRSSDKQILWATYQGGGAQGTGASDEWRGLDKAYDLVAYKGSHSGLKYLYVTGSTMSTDFPTRAEPLTVFANADETPFAGSLGGEHHAAFILAYTQLDGKLHWSTTMGADGEIWYADGLGVDVLDDGTLMWVGSTSGSTGGAINGFPYVTPTGAYTKLNGGGFFVLFNNNYQYEWCSPFNGQGHTSGVYDVKLVKDPAQSDRRRAYLTGATGPNGFDTYLAPGSIGYLQSTFGGGLMDAYFAVLDLEDHQLVYSTLWGGDGNDYGTAIETQLQPAMGSVVAWIGGLSKSTDLVAEQLPLPNFFSNGAHHQTTNAGEADAMLLRFDGTRLRYGTLYGGAGHDAILDLELGKVTSSNDDAQQLYMVGETRSETDIVLVENDLLYQQDQLGNTTGASKRDGFLLTLDTHTGIPVWSTYVGGLHTDKCWGVAAAPNELFVVGGTVSDQNTFPLKEFNTSSPVDWYDGDLLNNIGNAATGHYSFSWLNFLNPYGEIFEVELLPGHSFDAFITSFGVAPNVSISEGTEVPLLRPVQVDPEGLWMITLTEDAQWIRVHDATGRIVSEERVVSSSNGHLIDLRDLSSGLYVVTCGSLDGAKYSTKLYRP